MWNYNSCTIHPLTALSLCLCFLGSACSPATTRIVLVPDTQTYAEKYPEILHSQVDWIAREGKKIDLVLQQGDLTQNNNDKEWGVVRSAFDKINGKVPFIVAAGNHDMGSAPGKFADTRNTTLFNSYFPVSYFSDKPYFGGTFEAGKSENAYFILKKGKIKWLVLTMEFGPRNSVLAWADSIAKKYPYHVGIVNTHSYMYSDDTRQGPGDNWRPQGYGVGKGEGADAVNDGEDIWEKLIRKNSNIRFVFSGHILNTGVGTLQSRNDLGKTVYQMLANYQQGVKNSIKGGNGWLRILTFDHKKGDLQVQTYSPYLNEYNTDIKHQFILQNISLQ